ncbi:MAG: polyketide synthase dehydratase domain-containing protein, partial [Anaerolineae bacterium]|nr:polyketide synthase dehydratase domain-containing protein [Anaerolineae bacterium]
GTLTLDALLAGMPLDFVVLLSSTSAVMGLAGQIDYAAANAFLDAFSHHKAADRASSWIALNWGMWQGTGMTAAAPEGDAEHYDDQVGAETGHPLLGRRLPTPDDRMIYLAAYDPQRHWILDEHRLKDGTALIPGTGYLEIARAALQSALPGKGTIQIENLLFLSPLDVDTPRQVRVMLEPRDDQTYQLSVASERDQGWHEHVLGTVSYSEMPGPEPVLIDRIRQRCPYQGVPTHQVDYLLFGPRWHNLKSIHQGVNEVLGALELADSFHDDLADYVIHPALLDIATSCGMPLIPGYTTDAPFYVPLSYKRVRLYQPVPQRMWSHVRYLNDGHSGGEIAAFDVTLLDVNGAVIAEIDEFTIKRMTNPDALIGAAVSGATARQSSSPLLDLARGVGITPEEGAQVFDRVLASRFGSQIIASSVELGALKKFTAHLNEADPASDSGIRQARPQLTGDYVAPHSPIERKLAEIWSELLGIEEVGIHDNFFDLGGHSLLAVRLFAQIRKLYQVAFSLSILFEAETIAELAERITQEGGAEASARRKAPRSRWNSLVEIQAGNPDRPRFFCMHDLNGHVLYYRDLARHLGQDQPFYALQAYGLDGSAVPDASVEAMAERYIREIRALQPRGPYYLGGSSLGGLIAFELAQRLRAQGEDVALLALFDSWSPEYLNRL